MHRPDRKLIHMLTAFAWSMRSEDPRLKVGAVVTTTDMKRVLSVGYNGPAKGLGSDYIRNIPGNSGCLHAEDNAIAMCDNRELHKIMFVTHVPCEMCAHRIVNAGFSKLYYSLQYRDNTGLRILTTCGISVEQLSVHDSANLVDQLSLLILRQQA